MKIYLKAALVALAVLVGIAAVIALLAALCIYGFGWVIITVCIGYVVTGVFLHTVKRLKENERRN